MTESEWLTTDDCTGMLHAIGETNGDHPDREFYGQAPRKMTCRQFRMICCAMARSAWGKFTIHNCREIIAAAETYADDASELVYYYGEAADVFEAMDAAPDDGTHIRFRHLWEPNVARHCCVHDSRMDEGSCITVLSTLRRQGRSSDRDLAHAIRDVAGNPWRAPLLPRLSEDVLRVAGGVASTLFEGKLDPHSALILADALDDAGNAGELVWHCGNSGKHSHRGLAGSMAHGVFHASNPMVPHHHHDEKCPRVIEPNPLTHHLRQTGPHYAGCWVLESIAAAVKNTTRSKSRGKGRGC